jgi:hypothetical protein
VNPASGGASQRCARARPTERTFPAASRSASARCTVRWLSPAARRQRVARSGGLDACERRDEHTQAADFHAQARTVRLIGPAHAERAGHQRIEIDITGPGFGERTQQREQQRPARQRAPLGAPTQAAPASIATTGPPRISTVFPPRVLFQLCRSNWCRRCRKATRTPSAVRTTLVICNCTTRCSPICKCSKAVRSRSGLSASARLRKWTSPCP